MSEQIRSDIPVRSSQRAVKWARLLAFGLALLSVGLIVFIFGILYCYPSLKPNFFADVLWTLALFAITAGIAAYAYLRNRNILFTFFDIDQHDPLVAIYVSNILIMPKGAWALEQTKEGYAGPAVVKVEYEAALEIQKLLTADKISLVPEQLRDWFDRIYFRNRRLEVNITFSERTGHTFPTGTTTTGLTIGDFGWERLKRSIEHNLKGHIIIVIGSNIYNSVAKWYLEEYSQNYDNYYEITRDEQSNRIIKRISRDGKVTEILERDRQISVDGISGFQIEPAFIMRFQASTRTVFICAGIADWATEQSVRYLKENWRILHRKFVGQRDFGLSLSCLFHERPEERKVTLISECYLREDEV